MCPILALSRSTPYMNSPHSCPAKWTAKLQQEIATGRVKEAIALVPSITCSNWLQSIMRIQPICFWSDKINFLNAKYQPKLVSR